MPKNKLRKMAQYFVRHVQSGEKLRSNWNKYLRFAGVTHQQFMSDLYDALETVGDDLGLSEIELIELANRLGLKRIKRLVARKISPKKREEFFPEFANESAPASPAAGTSFTSSANVAPYMVPIGAKAHWKSRRKKRKG